MNQSDFLDFTGHLLKAREKSRVQSAIVLELLLNGWKNGARFWSQSLA